MPRRQIEMTAEQARALSQAEARLREVEGKTARRVAEARAEVAQAMLAAGPSAVARRGGLTRQAVHDYIRRNTTPSPEGATPGKGPRAGRGQEVIDPVHLRALERAEARLRKAEESLASARTEVAKAMLIAGPAAVARRDGVSRQSVWDFIRRNTQQGSSGALQVRPSRRAR